MVTSRLLRGNTMSIKSVALSKVGCPYIWGARGSLCTPEYRKKMIRNYPNYASANKRQCPVVNGSATTCDGCRWYDNVQKKPLEAFDCAGLCNYVFGKCGIKIGQGATTIWDTTKYTSRGRVGEGFPYNEVCLVFRGDDKTKEHIGIYTGDDYVIEAANFSLGVVRRIFDSSKWDYWMIPKENTPMPFEAYEAKVKTKRDGYITMWKDNTKREGIIKVYDDDVVRVLSAPDAKGFVKCEFGLVTGYCDSKYLVPLESDNDVLKKLYEVKGIIESLIDKFNAK